MSAILKFCVILLLIYGTNGQIATCNFKNEYHWTTGQHASNISYYSCLFDSSQTNFDEKITRIDGQHDEGLSNADVKFINNYFHNKLETFSSIFCQTFPHLEVIQIDDADLEFVDENSFLNCKKLDKLVLDDNRILELPENLFIEQEKLAQLWLSNNQLNFLPDNIFDPLVNLKLLYLNNNNIQSINPKWFKNLQNVKDLGLYENQISEIPSNSFAGLRNLEKLWLFKNEIKILHSKSFNGLQNLGTLGINNNEISDLPAGVFAPLRKAKEISLNNNKLTTIRSNTLGVHNKLNKVLFESNQINSIDPKFFDKIKVTGVNFRYNKCTQYATKKFNKTSSELKKCYDNYQHRVVQAPTSCGRAVVGQGNIIGGTQIKRGSYPWITLTTPSGQFFCGGTLVSSRKVVTAAHCIQDKGMTQQLLSRLVVVLLGFHDLSLANEIGRVSHAVQDIHIHSDWHPLTSSYDADIAVLVLFRDVTFDEYIQPICMTSADSRIATMTDGVVVGNGKGSDANEYEYIPKILKMPTQTSENCTEKDRTFQNLLTARTFCAGSGTGQGVCTGDSGSGFIVQIENASYLRGIVSASLFNSYLSCNVDSYSVFTDVLKFISWIDELSTAPDIAN